MAVVNFSVALARVGGFFSFIADRLAHFSQLRREEQIAYIAVSLGLLLVLVSLVLFML